MTPQQLWQMIQPSGVAGFPVFVTSTPRGGSKFERLLLMPYQRVFVDRVASGELKLRTFAAQPEPPVFHREDMGVWVDSETTETETFPKSGSNRAGAISRGASPNVAPSGARLPKRGQRPLQRLASPLSDRVEPKKATPVADLTGNGGEA